MLPDAFCKKMETLLGAEYPDFLTALDRPRAVGLRLNPLKTEDPPVLPFALTPVPWEPTGFYYDPEARPGLHPWHDAGLYYLQEPSAMAPAALLDPQPGERVLDLCAAPGGKTTQIAGRMRNRGLLVCNEIHPKRAAVLSGNVERLGIANALVLNEHPARLSERFPAFFDRVLVDAPCSGEGMFRKHDATWADWSPETVAMCARRQAEILDSAAVMLRPGGRLVYSTCTFSPEENEGTVSAFLRRHPDFSVEQTDAPWFAPGRPDWVPDGQPELARTLRLWPHLLRGEGHFAAVLRRGEAGEERFALRPSPCGGQSDRLPAEVRELLRALNVNLPAGLPVLWGERVFWAPPDLPELRGLKALRPGLALAVLKKGRAEPAHALALYLREASAVRDLSQTEAAHYLRGETLPTALGSGWTLLRLGGCSLGWAKAAGGVLKNHYPKGLRTLG
ncbi:MAG: RsmF rRNA methyltransferase first C-terminal domain-containing protein [Oscillospiraceae bacterium]|nr:RsmF rRNA methyltransferase first C-terminal domain-containing protein [Oscillospiraceae bacterium]